MLGSSSGFHKQLGAVRFQQLCPLGSDLLVQVGVQCDRTEESHCLSGGSVNSGLHTQLSCSASL